MFLFNTERKKRRNIRCMSLPWLVTLSMVLNLTWHQLSTSLLFVGNISAIVFVIQWLFSTSLTVLSIWCVCCLCCFFADQSVQGIFLCKNNWHLFILNLMVWHSFTFCFLLSPSLAYVSILGMHLFGCKFGSEKDKETLPDRKNFDSLLWAIVTVFQVSITLFTALCSV